MKIPQYCLPPLLFQILSNPFSPTFLSPSTSVLSCFFGWRGDHATFYLLFYLMVIWIYTSQALVPWYQKNLDVCFMQQRVRFTDIWHIMWFFIGTLIWYHKHTRHTQGPVDWHTHINVYLHHLLCAQSSYLYYIKWLKKWLNE